ncbi:MAG: ABC transporter permease [Firmicutes bacterium]|jgi:peptide/nickel transport system permease protein|nr:ABC transporter permease [Bacillota bacterium]
MFKVVKSLLQQDKRFLFGFIVMAILLVGGALAAFSPHDPRLWSVVPRDLPPSSKYWLGTNSMGQDVFWQALWAIRNSLVMAAVAVVSSRIIAVAAGLLAGYRGGFIDRILMTVTDSFVILPLLPILILITSVFKSRLSVGSLGILLGVFGWAWDARVIRSQVLSLREREFTYTAVLSGMSTGKIIFREYMPFIFPLITATAMNNMLWAIGMEVTLAVLGLVSLEVPTLGTMIHWAVNSQAMLLGIWWWILTPVVLCVFIFLALYLLSLSINEFLDPRIRVQRLQEIKG